MPVDMHEFKFILSLEKTDRYEPSAGFDHEVGEIDFPAWRALFTSALLWGHSTKYRLPTFAEFFSICQKSYKHKRHEGRFDEWFEPKNVGRTTERIKFFYESGMAETYLYVCLVDAFEDILKNGFVMYDPRFDWKQKWDAAVIVRSCKFGIDAFLGASTERKRIKERREVVERQRKRNNMMSTHLNNVERDEWVDLRISLSNDYQIVNGIKLFSIEKINTLLRQIYDISKLDQRFFFPRSREDRNRLYDCLIKNKSVKALIIDA
jgi:hypothetical protein